MYAKYTYASGTKAEILCSHLVQLYTGETTLANLNLNAASAWATALDLTNNVYAAGWQIWDFGANGNTGFTVKQDNAVTALTNLASWTHTGGNLDGTVVPKGMLFVSAERTTGVSTIKVFKTKDGRDANSGTDVVCSYTGSGTGVQTLVAQNGSGVTFSVSITAGDYGIEYGYIGSPYIVLRNTNDDVGYSYVGVSTATGSRIYLYSYETWTSGTTHTFANLGTGSNSYITANFTTSAVLRLAASSNGIAASILTPARAVGDMIIISKRTREQTIDVTTGTPLPLLVSTYVQSTANTVTKSCRLFSNTGADAVTASCGIDSAAYFIGDGGATLKQSPTAPLVFGPNKVQKYIGSRMRMISGQATVARITGALTFDIAMFHAGSNDQEIYCDGALYALWSFDSYMLAIRKG